MHVERVPQWLNCPRKVVTITAHNFTFISSPQSGVIEARRLFRNCVGDNGVDLTGLLGDIKEDWGSGGRKYPLSLIHI